ncbi:tail assembly protein [Agrobacterium vitis]|uniref:NlpC/P60 family protein n=1 Tax=Rhizobium/Agrobacterium group TaxID=227290 RepID=UPI001572B733|nr:MULTISPECIES: NlpC/P60 family protein [Rhizobium/Agrobacterium group]MCF1446621.1 NlpC/P60 family protein [Allorhizobium ampelinum]NSZ53467.1 C40 family peptidase [Agrobacterium vitis]NTA32226.1 C40 family peptidase [Agrobacterium vitis]BCH63205.1 tail assembly protein [Agrobacterium vitis]
MAHWSQDYVGIPHAPHGIDRESGVNCWTLVCLTYREQFGIDLPTYTGDFVSIDEAAEIETLFADEAAIRWSVVDTPAEFDLAIFRRGRFETHVGVIVRPGVMLHVVGEDQAKLERYDNGVWKPRLKRFLRHLERLQVAA